MFTATVTAGGFPNLRISYQWRLDGVAISGATGSSLIASAAGSLTVLVTATNNQGTDTRESAPVTVSPALAAPEITEARIAPEIGAVDDVFTVIAEAAGVPAPSLTYQWALDGIAIGGATEASYIAIARGKLSVRVTARNSEGADTVESDPVAVEPAATAPAITALKIAPEDGRVGDAFTAIVEASGTPSPDLGYQWMLDGVAIDGATTVGFTAVAEGALSVRVTATNGEGTDSRISVAVPVASALVAPAITTAAILPASGRVGDSFSVAVAPSGEPAPDLSYQWRIDGVDIGGATGSAFVPGLEGSLSVRVTATSIAGSDTLETAPVTVSAALSSPVIGNITIAPATGRAGDAFTGVAEVVGEPAPEVAFQWLLDGVAVEGAIGPSFVPATSGALSLRVTATNSQGSDLRESAAVLLEPALEAPRLTALAITPETGRVGDSFTVTATATGDPAPVLDHQWLLDGVEIAGATGTSLVATAEGSLSVRVTASNVAGSDTGESEVVPVASALQAPAITNLAISPEAGRVGDSFAAAVDVTGNPIPQIAYQWLLDGTAIEGATEPSFIPAAAGALSVLVTATNAEGSESRQSTSALVEPALAAPKVKSADILPNVGRVGDTFTIVSTAVGNPAPELRYVWVLEDQVIEGATDISYTAADVGTLFVRVIATNSEGEDIRESGAVEVEPALVAPSITDATIQPSAGRVGDTFLVSVAATGNPVPDLAFQWIIDGVAIAGANAGTFIPATEGSLSVRVTATSSKGSDSRETAAVPVAPALAAPRIREARIEPASGRVGDVFAAMTAATGNPEPLVSYQWMLDGAPISGATGQTYTAGAVGALGLRVTARNTEGEATTEAVPVTVEAALAPPVVTSATIAPASGQVGTTFTASATASGNPTPVFSYQWLLSGVAIAGATAPSFSATAPGTLTVRVTASNSLGTDSRESAAATITSDPSPAVYETGTFVEGVFA
jgi:hypothetical protein